MILRQTEDLKKKNDEILELKKRMNSESIRAEDAMEKLEERIEEL